MVIMPSGPTARRILSAHPSDMVRNCFVTCSPKRVRRGARSLPRLFMKSSPENLVEGMDWVLTDDAVGATLLAEVIEVGAMMLAPKGK